MRGLEKLSDWEMEAEAFHRSIPAPRVRVDLTSADWREWARQWSGVDLEKKHPGLLDLERVVAGKKAGQPWLDATLRLIGVEILRFRGAADRGTVCGLLKITPAEARHAIALTKERTPGLAYEEAVKREVDLTGLPRNPIVRGLELVHLYGIFQNAQAELVDIEAAWTHCLAWRSGVPLDEIAEAAGRTVPAIRRQIGGTPPPRPVIHISQAEAWTHYLRSQRARRQAGILA